MKSSLKIQYLICISIIVCCNQRNSIAQGVGNHITMSLQNCTQLSGDSIRFDLYVVSDGAVTSDLRLNSIQYGINFNTGILQSGATITTSYVNGSTDTILKDTSFAFPPSNFPGHIRIVECSYTGNNTGITMVIGHQYRVGTFILACSANWVNFSSPNFALQGAIQQCKTVCAADAWISDTCWGTAFYITGTTDSLRSLSAPCSLTLLSTNDLAAQSTISIYPNLIHGEGSIHIALQKNLSSGRVYIFNTLGEKVYDEAINGKEKTINCKLFQGFYFVQVRDGERQYTQKLVVQ
jgi:hypothetical protein